MKITQENVSIRDYLDTRISDISSRFDQRIDATDLLLSKLEENTSSRFSTVNEFRQALSDQTSNFVTRAENSDLTNRIDRIEGRIDINDGRSKGINVWWGYLIGAVGLVIAGITIISY